MKKFFSASILFLVTCSLFFAEEYITIDNEYNETENGIHYVIDDYVNVRSEPSKNSKVLFQLNTGDKVQIIEYDEDWEWILAEGYYAPWYKISCSKGIGYICGRYISCRELVADFDNDTESEILVCLSVSDSKNIPSYALDFRYMSDSKHVEYYVIKNSTRKKFTLTGYNKNCYLSYEFLNYKTSKGSPVDFLAVRYSFADPNNYREILDLYYLDDNFDFVYFTTLKNSSNDDCYDSEKNVGYLEKHSEKLKFNNNIVYKEIEDKIHYFNDDDDILTTSTITYRWDGKTFLK